MNPRHAHEGRYEEEGWGGPQARGMGPWGHPGHGGWPPRGGPWKGGRRVRRGDIRQALLSALADGPAHGYELMGRLEERSGGMWRPSPGSVYPTLQMLEEEGLVAGRDESGKRVYEVTEEGRAAAEAARRARQDRQFGPEDPRDLMALRRALQSLALAARQISFAGDQAQVEAATAVVTEARQRLYRLLAGD